MATIIIVCLLIVLLVNCLSSGGVRSGASFIITKEQLKPFLVTKALTTARVNKKDSLNIIRRNVRDRKLDTT